jgi:hypothetical protein
MPNVREVDPPPPGDPTPAATPRPPLSLPDVRAVIAAAFRVEADDGRVNVAVLAAQEYAAGQMAAGVVPDVRM